MTGRHRTGSSVRCGSVGRVGRLRSRRSSYSIVGVLAAIGAVMLAGAPSTMAANNGDVPEFIISCPFSHRLSDDPIEDPGQPGSTYSYDYFGNTTTNADSTLTSLLAGSTTCDEQADTAAYWAPTVYENNVALTPLKATIYYRNVGADITKLQTFPAGFSMVGGNDDDNPTKALPGKMTGWACRKPTGLKGAWTQTVPTCPSGEYLVFRVQFPECWNGTTSANEADNMARIGHGDVCPKQYPILLPRVSMTISFNSRGGPGITLSDGSPVSGAHMDFINSWDQATLDQLVQTCLLQDTTKCRFAADPGDDEPL